MSTKHSKEADLRWYRVADPSELPEGRAKTVVAGDKSLALTHFEGKFNALDNVCRHQGGPLGEGKIVDGCITCPWHGFQYAPETGASPPPFTEKVSTFNVRVRDGRVLVDPESNAPGTYAEPARIGDATGESHG